MKPWSTEWKQAALQELKDQWSSCEGCNLCRSRKSVVFGSGNPDADIMLVGYNPDAVDNRAGRPFEGLGGELLRNMWESVLGESWEDLYLTTVVACMPAGDKEPTTEEQKLCLPRLQEIIYIVDPLIIITAGKSATGALIRGRSWSMDAIHGDLFSSPDASTRVQGEHNGAEIPGRVFPRKDDYKNIVRLEYDVVPIYHPTHILKNDNRDEKTGEFPANGMAVKTLDDLKTVADMIKDLKEEYSNVARSLERE